MIRLIILAISILWSCVLHAATSEAMTSDVILDTRISPMITSDLGEQQISFRRLMKKYAVTTNFGATRFMAKGLPRGISINKNTGVISGKPTKKGNYKVNIIAQKVVKKKVVISVSATKNFKVF